MSENVFMVYLTGDLTIGHLDAAVESVREALAEKHKMTLLNIAGLTDIDLSGIQLFYSAKREADRQGTALHLTGAVPDTIVRRFLEGGFLDEAVVDGRELDEKLVGITVEEQANA